MFCGNQGNKCLAPLWEKAEGEKGSEKRRFWSTTLYKNLVFPGMRGGSRTNGSGAREHTAANREVEAPPGAREKLKCRMRRPGKGPEVLYSGPLGHWYRLF